MIERLTWMIRWMIVAFGLLGCRFKKNAPLTMWMIEGVFLYYFSFYVYKSRPLFYMYA